MVRSEKNGLLYIQKKAVHIVGSESHGTFINVHVGEWCTACTPKKVQNNQNGCCFPHVF